MIKSKISRNITALVACMGMATSAHATDDRGSYPSLFTVSPKGVNMQTGNFTMSVTDVSIGPLQFTRSCQGAPTWLPESYGNLGGWSHNYRQGTYYDNSTNSSNYFWVVVDGKKYQFAYANGNIFPWNIEALGTNLQSAGNSFTFTNRSGDVYSFSPITGIPNTNTPLAGNQALTSVVYADGSRIDYSYNAAAQPRVIKSNKGYAIVLDYGSNGSIMTACGYNTAIQYVDANSTCASATLKASYGYTYSPTSQIYMLTSAYTQSSPASSSGRTVTMTYTDSGIRAYGTASPANPLLLTCVSMVNSSTCAITNVYGPQSGEPPQLTKWDQVRKQTTVTGEVWLYSYEPDLNENPRQPGENRFTYATMIDPQGASTVLTYNIGLLTTMDSPQGRFNYLFNGTVPLQTTFPEGNKESFGRDSRQNLTSRSSVPKPNSGLSTVATTWTYPGDQGTVAGYPSGCTAASPKLCNKPRNLVDANGNQTDYLYDPAHGGVLTETGPAVNGVRPQTRYFYTQRSAWVLGGGGGYVQAPPIWLLTSKSICRTGAAAGAGCSVAGDEVLTSYDYGPDSGPNNLLLRGTIDDSGGLALRTCYGYDWQGDRISETKPRAGLASCS